MGQDKFSMGKTLAAGPMFEIVNDPNRNDPAHPTACGLIKLTVGGNVSTIPVTEQEIRDLKNGLQGICLSL